VRAFQRKYIAVVIDTNPANIAHLARYSCPQISFFYSYPLLPPYPLRPVCA
jgi:hypothetical protein